MRRETPPYIHPYGIAAAAVVGATVLTLLLLPLLNYTASQLFFVAVAFSAWYCGLEAGLLATLLSVMAIAYFFIPPYYSPDIGLDDIVRLGMFGIVAVSMSSLNAESRAAKHRAEASAIELIEREEQYRRIVETANEAIWMVDAQWQTTYVNQPMVQMFGYSVEEMLGRSIFDFMDAEARTLALEQIERRQQGKSDRFDFRYRRKDGSDLWAIVSSTPILNARGEFAGRIAMLVDISDRKLALAALQESEKRYRAFVEQSSEGIWRFEVDKPISIESSEDEQLQYFYEYAYLAECNEVMAQMYGFSSARELVGARLNDFLPSFDSHNLEYLRAFIRSGYRLADAESHEVDKEGNPKYFSNNLVGIVEDGLLVRVWGTQRDITERKRLEASLQESEERFRNMADTAPVSIWMSGTDKLCFYFNKVWLDFTGRTLEQEMGNGWAEGVHPDDLQRCLDTYVAAFEARESFKMEYRLRRFDGEYRWILDAGVPRFMPDGSFVGYIGSCIDISDRKLAEEAQRSSEEQIRLIADCAPSLISYVDSQQRYLFNNKTYSDWFGQDRAEITGKSLQEVLGEAAYQEIRPHVEAALAGKKVSYETTIPYRDAGERYIRASYVPHFGERGEVKGFIALIADISDRKQAEEEILRLNQNLQRRVAELQTLLEVIPVGVGIAEDAECKHIKVNPYFAKQLGISIEANASFSAPPEERPSNFKVCKNGRELAAEELPMQVSAAKGVEIIGEEIDIIRAEGKTVKVLISAAPLFDERGKSRGSIAAVLDITDRKRAEEAQRFIAEASAVLASSLDYSTTLSSVARLAVPHIADWCTVHALEDDAGVQLLALAHANPEKVKWARELQERYPYDPNQPRGVPEVLRTGKSEIYQEIPDELLVASARDPEHLEILREVGFSSVIIVPMKARDRTLGAISFMAAESGRRYDSADLALAEAIAYHAALAVDNARLYEMAQRDRAEAEQANRLKDEFLATLSHELRTPLTSMLGWARMLRSQKLDEAAKERAIETIERNAKSQAQLIEDILDVSRIITGKLRLNVRPVEVNAVVEAALDALRPAAQAKSIFLNYIPDRAVNLVSGDADRLQQVVWNLLSNAIKFTSNGGSVFVVLESNNSQVEISVTDTGKGISREFLPHVFDRFRQADGGSTRSHGGIGLGLAIVRHLVELHGGTVCATSEGEGKGATFTVTLPLLEGKKENFSLPPSPTLPLPLSSSLPLSGVRVLVVDDDADARELIGMALESSGAEVKTAVSAAEAIAAIGDSMPDVLLSDIEMPHEDGYTLIRKVKAIAEQLGKQIPAAALTAYARKEDRQRALQAGFQLHVPKPIDPAELVAVVASLAGRTGNLRR